MRRVTKTAGIVAPTMWDRSPANEVYGCFWDAVEAIDTTPSGLRNKGRMGLPKPFHSSGRALLTEIEATDLLMGCQFLRLMSCGSVV